MEVPQFDGLGSSCRGISPNREDTPLQFDLYDFHLHWILVQVTNLEWRWSGVVDGSMSFIDNSIDWLGAEQYFHQDISGITRGVARVGQNTWGNLRCVGADRKPLGALHTENLLTHC